MVRSSGAECFIEARNASSPAGQKFLLFLIKLAASREERSRNYSLMSFIPALKNKTRWKGPVRTKIFFLPPGFSAALRDKAARQFIGNSLTQVSSGKKRRKFCPLFPCKPDLVPLGGIAAGGRATARRQAFAAGGRATAGGQVLAAGSQARTKKGPQDECLKAPLLSFYLNISFSFSAKLPFFW